jgi:hypothetical protein
MAFATSIVVPEPQRRNELDRLTAQVHNVLQRRTRDAIEIGNLLIKAENIWSTARGKRGSPSISISNRALGGCRRVRRAQIVKTNSTLEHR